MVRPRIRFILIPSQPLSPTLNTNAAVKKMILFYERILRFLWHTTQINMIWRKIIYREIRRLGKAPDLSFVKDFFGSTIFPGPSVDSRLGCVEHFLQKH